MATLLKIESIFFIHPKENSFSNGLELTCRTWNQNIVPIDALSIYVSCLLIHVAKPTTVPIWLNIYLIAAQRRMSPRISHFHLDCLESIFWNADGAMIVNFRAIK